MKQEQMLSGNNLMIKASVELDQVTSEAAVRMQQLVVHRLLGSPSDFSNCS